MILSILLRLNAVLHQYRALFHLALRTLRTSERQRQYGSALQGACYGKTPEGWSGESLLEGQCIIRTVDDLFRVSGVTGSSANVHILSNLYLLREVRNDAANNGGGFVTQVQSTTAALYLHRMTLDGGSLGDGGLLIPERGRGLHTLSGITLAEGVMLLPRQLM